MNIKAGFHCSLISYGQKKSTNNSVMYEWSRIHSQKLAANVILTSLFDETICI